MGFHPPRSLPCRNKEPVNVGSTGSRRHRRTSHMSCFEGCALVAAQGNRRAMRDGHQSIIGGPGELVYLIAARAVVKAFFHILPVVFGLVGVTRKDHMEPPSVPGLQNSTRGEQNHFS